jgi:membrane peptidoglycan carboxypeptidase
LCVASSSSRPKKATSGSASARPPAGSTKKSAAPSGTSARSAKGSGKATASSAGAKTAGSGGKKKHGFFNYPRAGKGPIRRWMPSWRVVVGTMLTGIAVVCGLIFAAYQSIDIPEPTDFALAERSTVLYVTGEEMTTFADQDRIIIDADEIPDLAKHAVVAAEDRSFYENSGIDPKGLARAVYGNIKAAFSGGRQTGGSTITQQYAERYFTTGTTTDYVGKFEEALLAVKLDRSTSKDQILTDYMNTIYFGRGAYGIESASEKYFAKHASDLTVSEAAMLAGIIPSPSNWDPRNNEDKAKERWAYVLDGMVLKDWLTQTERDALVFPEVQQYEPTNTLGGPQGYLAEMVVKELAAEGITEEKLNQGGYTITTTIDKGLQDMAVASVDNMPADKPANLSTSVVTIDSATGGYLVLYGGADYVTTQFNSATQGTAQAGSTFKPFTLMAGLEAGKTLKDTFDGNSPRTFGDATVRNFSGTSYGTVTLEKATANSINTAYTALNEEIGPDKTVDVATRAGVPADTTDLIPVLSNVLGTASVHPVDVAAAYTTFATNGIVRTPHIVKSVTTKVEGEDSIYYEFEPGADQRAFTEENTAELTYALTQVVEKGSGEKASALGVPIAGKTGTSNDNKSAWFVGYTPQFVTAVALYQSGPNGEQESITPFGDYVNSEITGSSVPLDLWVDYMGKLLNGREVVEFPERTASTATATPTPTATEEPSTEAPQEEAPAPTTVPVPSGLVGGNEAAARAALSAAGLNPSVSQKYDASAQGTVLSVSPSQGTSVEVGSTVAVVVSRGPEPVVPTPNPTPVPSVEPTVNPEPTPSPSTTQEGGGAGSP